jgi:glycosyltransferase involved in cell wall biosynthesis
MDALPPPEDDRGKPRLAYVMTHYPRVALTFIAAEIAVMRELGFELLPIAMNLPEAADLPTEAYRQEAEATVYLKYSRIEIMSALLTSLVRHPRTMLHLFRLTMTSSRGDLPVLVRRFAHLAYATLVARTCRARGISHIHAHFGQAPATIAWFASALLNANAGERCRWSFTIHGFQDFVDTTSARLDLKAHSAAFIACISDFTRAQLCQATHPSTWERFKVVRCGIDPDFLTERSPEPFRTTPIVVVVGRLSPEKGHRILLEALSILAHSGVVMRAQFIGDGPFGPTLRHEAEKLGIASQIEFAGERLPHEVSDMLADADMFCLPSFSEGLPVSLMEAMAIGVPVVTTWISGIPELARHGETALMVPAGNSAALAEALRQMASDAHLRQQLVRNARRAVEEQHDFRRNARTLASLFQRVAAMGEATWHSVPVNADAGDNRSRQIGEA